MAAHRHELRPRFYELDPYGHVNHSVYIQYFESARIALLADIGYGLDTMADDDMQLVVIGLATRFVGAAGLHEPLVIETGVVESGRVRSRWAQRIVRASDDAGGEAEVLTTQLIDFATTNRSGRPRRAPEGLAAVLEPFQVDEDWLGSHAP